MVRATPARGTQGGVADLWRRTLPRVAAEVPGLELAVTGMAERTVDLHRAMDGAAEDALLLALNDPSGAPGVAIVDPGLLTALIEVQTTGRVSTLRRDPRRPTAVDAALARPVLDAWLLAVAEARGDAAAPGTGRQFADLRAATLSLEEGEVRETRIDLDLAAGRRGGSLRLVLPLAQSAKAGPDPDALRTALLPVEAPMYAVLCRVRLPLSRVAGFAPGEVIPLEGVTPRRIRLEAPLGRLVAPAHLGQSRGHRAVRVLPAEEPAPSAPPALDSARVLPGAAPWDEEGGLPPLP